MGWWARLESGRDSSLPQEYRQSRAIALPPLSKVCLSRIFEPAHPVSARASSPACEAGHRVYAPRLETVKVLCKNFEFSEECK